MMDIVPEGSRRAALAFLVGRDDESGIFDREADEGGYRSAELEQALDVIRTALASGAA
jgi:hypothetical protein